ncbi:hypothetical protein [Photobacterium leiognathi]|uniref:hypothetical protein n=1 Tax=Photobacterium leiognathi TaxID=553611 RepID=UPI003DA11031
MSDLSLSHALCDMRKAQRLVVAFNQRMLPIIECIASELNANFYYWQSLYNKNSCRGATNPVKKRKWDFSPLHNASFLYLSDNAPSEHEVSPDSYLLAFHLITDTAIDDAFIKENKPWNPIDITEPAEESRSLLRIYIYQPSEVKKQKEGWWKLYANNPWPECNGEIMSLEQGGTAMGVEVDIAELVTQDEINKLIERVKDRFECQGYYKNNKG